jgi:hypothetical protein
MPKRTAADICANIGHVQVQHSSIPAEKPADGYSLVHIDSLPNRQHVVKDRIHAPV